MKILAAKPAEQDAIGITQVPKRPHHAGDNPVRQGISAKSRAIASGWHAIRFACLPSTVDHHSVERHR
jgi:hypothetical protein